MADPRVFFAAERTLLAWIRTGLTVMAFGFVVARFGLFLDLVAHQKFPASVSGSTYSVVASKFLGVTLIFVGVFCLFASVVQHRSFLKTLPRQDLPPGYKPGIALACAVILGLVGLFVAGFLAFEKTS